MNSVSTSVKVWDTEFDCRCPECRKMLRRSLTVMDVGATGTNMIMVFLSCIMVMLALVTVNLAQKQRLDTARELVERGIPEAGTLSLWFSLANVLWPIALISSLLITASSYFELCSRGRISTESGEKFAEVVKALRKNPCGKPCSDHSYAPEMRAEEKKMERVMEASFGSPSGKSLLTLSVVKQVQRPRRGLEKR